MALNHVVISIYQKTFIQTKALQSVSKGIFTTKYHEQCFYDWIWLLLFCFISLCRMDILISQPPEFPAVSLNWWVYSYFLNNYFDYNLLHVLVYFHSPSLVIFFLCQTNKLVFSDLNVFENLFPHVLTWNNSEHKQKTQAKFYEMLHFQMSKFGCKMSMWHYPSNTPSWLLFIIKSTYKQLNYLSKSESWL